MEYVSTTLSNLIQQTAFFNLTVGNYIMIAVACFFLYLAIRKEYEPLLLLPIAFGMLLAKLVGIVHAYEAPTPVAIVPDVPAHSYLIV